MTIASDVENSQDLNPLLNLIHTTTVDLFRLICLSGQMVPQTCHIMHKELTYFFYGRPAYRPGKISVTSRNHDSRPVFMLFDRHAISSISGIFPCDTGAHKAGLYSPYLDGYEFSELDCISVTKAEKRIVTRYFLNNNDYFFGEAVKVLDPAAHSSVAASFHHLLLADRAVECDDRLLTIEMTQQVEFSLVSSLSMVILPDFMVYEPKISVVLEQWKHQGIVVKRYRPQTITSAGMIVEQMFPLIGESQGIQAWPS